MQAIVNLAKNSDNTYETSKNAAYITSKDALKMKSNFISDNNLRNCAVSEFGIRN